MIEAFKSIKEENEDIVKIFKHIILTAPDIDAVIFKEQIAPKIIGEDNHITLYCSSNDKALKISDKWVNGGPRIGQTESLCVIKVIETIDATKVNTGFLCHSYPINKKLVIYDIAYLIKENLMADRRQVLERVLLQKELYYWKFKK